jgi:hypothetical protein
MDILDISIAQFVVNLIFWSVLLFGLPLAVAYEALKEGEE